MGKYLVPVMCQALLCVLGIELLTKQQDPWLLGAYIPEGETDNR